MAIVVTITEPSSQRLLAAVRWRVNARAGPDTLTVVVKRQEHEGRAVRSADSRPAADLGVVDEGAVGVFENKD